MSHLEDKNSEITRKAAREQAFVLVFEKTFHDYGIDDIIENAAAADDLVIDGFAKKEAQGVYDNLEQIDSFISANLRGWSINRISRVALSVLRLAVYEMKYAVDIPVSVSINEAVEIAKKFGSDDDPSYINGVLGSISRGGDN